jgi:hypothetical protein
LEKEKEVSRNYKWGPLGEKTSRRWEGKRKDDFFFSLEHMFSFSLKICN